MREFKRPNVLISSCIGDCECRYDGSNAKSSIIEKLEPFVNFKTVCPEVEMGLPIPRQALRIISPTGDEEKLVFSKTGEEWTKVMDNFSDKFLNTINHSDLEGAVLKSRSPSCGIKDVKVYKSFGKASPASQKTQGIFARHLSEKFPELALEDEGRLTNYDIREHFLTRIFTLAEFKSIKEKNSISELVRFQSENKYLLMVHSPGNLKKLGKIAANNEDRPIEDILEDYEHHLHKALCPKANTKRNINMLLHLFGYFSKHITSDEKVFFLDTLENYSDNRVPLSVPLSLIHSWVIRFDNEYLKNQTMFQAFPKVLTDVRDSGKSV